MKYAEIYWIDYELTLDYDLLPNNCFIQTRLMLLQH